MLQERSAAAGDRERARVARALSEVRISAPASGRQFPLNFVLVVGRTLGDGVLAQFVSAHSAIEAALLCAQAGTERDLPLHLGIHAGDVIHEDDNVWGGAVNISARIAGLSAPGEILVSATVRELARTSVGVACRDRGEHELKGVGEGQRVFAVASQS